MAHLRYQSKTFKTYFLSELDIFIRAVCNQKVP